MQSVQPKNGHAMTTAACIWLGLFPLLQGGTYAHITHDKWVIALLLTAVTLFCFLIDLLVSQIRRHFSRNSQEVPPARVISGILLPAVIALALLFWTVLSCLFSPFGSEIWLVGETARYEGLIIQLCYFALFFFFLFSRIHMRPVLLSAAAGISVFFIIVMLQRASGNPLGLYPPGRGYIYGHEFQGTIGNVDMDTGYLLLLAGLFLFGLLDPILERRKSKQAAFAENRTPWSRVCLFVYLLGFLLTVYLILTMEVQFGIIGLAVLSLFALLRLLPRKWRLPVLVFLIVLVLLVVWFWPGNSGGIWELHEILHGRGRLSFGSNRVAVWVFSLRMAAENLLFGGGSGTYRIRFNQFLAANSLAIPTGQDGVPLPAFFDNPHNEYIAQLTNHGLPAMLFFLALLLLAVFRRRQGWFPCLAPCSAAVLCYAVQAFFSFSVCLVAPMFWILLGVSFQE